ncbi:MAG: exodeoxyribonuclease VII large subunit, partial [Cyanothece sp. SIO2G6]|nr:exodeoxyribonuclease VII large subunit [Cyanothece sp. SIO2G6]
IPIISGIGHQRDESLADLVADVHVHTPTAAAETAAPLLTDLTHAHQERQTALALALHHHIQGMDRHLHALRDRLRRLQLDRRISQEQQRLQWHQQTLRHLVAQKLQQAESHCQLLRQTLETLDPATILQRGYALVRQQEGTIVRSADQVTPQQRLWIQLAQGQIQVTVETKESND